MAMSPPPSDGFESQGFEALARMVLDIPAETFDVAAAAFDGVAAALHDIALRLRALLGRLQEVLRGVAGDAAAETGEQLRSEIAAVAAAISGDGAALYRAGDAVAGAQRAMRDLAVERARVLAATPTPQVAAQFDELARRIATGLAQTYVQVGTSLSPIPGAGDGSGGQDAGAPPPAGVVNVTSVDDGAGGDGARQPSEVSAHAGPAPGGSTPGGSAPGTPVPISAFGAPAGPRSPDAARVGHGGASTRRGVAWTAGITDTAPPAAVLGRVAPPPSAGLAGATPRDVGDVSPPAVLRSAASFGPVPEEPTAAGQSSAHTDDATHTEQQQDALGRNRDESVSGMAVAPSALAAVEGRGRQPGEQQTRKDTGSRNPSDSRGDVLDDVLTDSGGDTARGPERVTPSPPSVVASELADMPPPASRRVPETGGAFGQGAAFENSAPVDHSAPSERNRPAPPGGTSLTPPGTLLRSSALHTPEPVAGSGGGGPPGQGPPPPMLPPMGGPMGGMGGGLAGRVEADRTREVSLQEDPGAWDDDVGGAPAVLGRR